MSTISIPAISRFGYIIPTKQLDPVLLENSIITITISPKTKKKQSKLDTYIQDDYKNNLSKPIEMNDFISQLQNW